MASPSALPESQRRELAEFLRTCRARLDAGQFGIPDGRRRRTKGLRREELAQLAGMSPTWYTWLEQARDVSVSGRTLSRLAQALALSTAERAYLFELAAKKDPDVDDGVTGEDLIPALQRVVDLIDAPAYVLDHIWEMRAWNEHTARLFAGWLERPSDTNLLHFVFLHPAARTLIVDWEDRAQRVVAEFRVEYGRHIDDENVTNLVDELSRESPFFARAWLQHAVVHREGGVRRFSHPVDGALDYEQFTFTLANARDLKLVVLGRRSG